MQEKIVWTRESHFGKVLKGWWDGLENDRASRAVLRRCATLEEVILSPAYQRFYRLMLACRWSTDAKNSQNDKLAAIAGLLAHVKKDDTERLAIAMSESNGDRPLLSELRFRDLLKTDSTEDLFISLRRTLPLLKGKASIHELASDVYYWGDETKKQWAYRYRWPA